MIHYDSVLIMYNLGVVPEEVGDMSLLSIHFDDHQAGVGMGYHASKQSPRWTPPLHMRLLHHRAKLTLKGQSSWPPSSASSRVFFHSKHRGQSPEQTVLKLGHTPISPTAFGYYTPFGVKLNGILETKLTFHKLSLEHRASYSFVCVQLGLCSCWSRLQDPVCFLSSS